MESFFPKIPRHIVEENLGEGAFGVVYLCHENEDASNKKAIKVVDLSKMESLQERD